MLAALLDPGRPENDLIASCESFFIDGSPPAELPSVSRGFVQRLIKIRMISQQEALRLARDLHRLEQHWQQHRQRFAQLAFSSGELEPEPYQEASDVAYRFLLALASSLEARDFDADAAIIQWPGPSFSQIAEAWYRPRRQETFEQRSRKANLIFARCGVDPQTAPIDWRQLVTRQRSDERRQHGDVMRQIARQRNLYDIALVLASGDVLGDLLKSTWWPLLERLRRPEPTAILPSPPPSPRPAVEEDKEEPHEALVPEDDLEHLEAAARTLSTDDQTVEEKSTWSIYQKPFLSENWLGLIGVFSLLAAWMFLTL